MPGSFWNWRGGLPHDPYLGYFNPPGERKEGVGVFIGDLWDRSAGGDLEQGGFGCVTVVHGLGMAHPHDTDGSSVVMNGVWAAAGRTCLCSPTCPIAVAARLIPPPTLPAASAAIKSLIKSDRAISLRRVKSAWNVTATEISCKRTPMVTAILISR